MREFAAADAGSEPVGEVRGCILAVGRDEFHQRREQARLGEAVAVDAIHRSFGPGFVEIAERGALLLAVGTHERCPELRAVKSLIPNQCAINRMFSYPRPSKPSAPP